MKVYQKSPQTLGINPFFSTNSSVSTGESQRVTSRVNSSSINGVSDFNNVEPNNNISNQMENTSMRNSNSNIEIVTNPELTFKIVTGKKFDFIKEQMEMNFDRCSDIEIHSLSRKRLVMTKNIIDQYGSTVNEVTFMNHKKRNCKDITKDTIFKKSYSKVRDRFMYMEGYITHKDDPNHRIYHSWNLSPEGEHLDFSLPDSQDYTYTGMLIPNDIVIKVVEKLGKKYLSILPFLTVTKVKNVNNNLSKGGIVY